MWLSLVEHYVRDVGAAGSNPVIPTTSEQAKLAPIFLYKKSVARVTAPPLSQKTRQVAHLSQNPPSLRKKLKCYLKLTMAH